jgi:nucleoside-diphosphate-sugar epimerase
MRVFVTGASGHIASAVIPELIASGHHVVGLARSDEAAAAVAGLGASVRRGDLADLDGLRQAAAEADGVIHLALFDRRQMSSGTMRSMGADQQAVMGAFGDALAGTGKPLVTASARGALGPLGRPATEQDQADPGGPAAPEIAAVDLAQRGVRSSVVRLPLITHSTLDAHGFAPALIGIARKTGVAGYAGDGTNRWPAVHTLDAGHLYRLALEHAGAGTRWHAVGEEGIPLRDIAQAIAGHLGVPTASIPDSQLQDHFGFLAALIGLDLPASSHITRQRLGWEPTHPGLLADLDQGYYFGS